MTDNPKRSRGDESTPLRESPSERKGIDTGRDGEHAVVIPPMDSAPIDIVDQGPGVPSAPPSESSGD